MVYAIHKLTLYSQTIIYLHILLKNLTQDFSSCLLVGCVPDTWVKLDRMQFFTIEPSCSSACLNATSRPRQSLTA